MTLSQKSRLKQAGIVLLFVLGCELVGILSALIVPTAQSAWFQALEKPFFNPPNWLFGPVWTLLYAFMGVAAYLVWRQRDRLRQPVRQALLLFAGQLALNAAWTPVFFGLQAVGAALVVIVLLDVALALTIRAFFPLSRTAGWLLVPYLAWVLFATVLNAAIWLLN